MVGFQTVDKHEGHQEYLIETETLGLKTKRFDCYEDNSMQMKICIDDFIAEQLNCSLPWTRATNLEVALNYCRTAEELSAFKNLSESITSDEFREKLTRKGCFIPNCKRTTWVKDQYAFTWHNRYGGSSVEIYIPSAATVIQRKEIRLRTFTTWIEDIGSYLGLYMGASILSLTDIVHVCFKRICKKIRP